MRVTLLVLNQYFLVVIGIWVSFRLDFSFSMKLTKNRCTLLAVLHQLAGAVSHNSWGKPPTRFLMLFSAYKLTFDTCQSFIELFPVVFWFSGQKAVHFRIMHLLGPFPLFFFLWIVVVEKSLLFVNWVAHYVFHLLEFVVLGVSRNLRYGYFGRLELVFVA